MKRLLLLEKVREDMHNMQPIKVNFFKRSMRLQQLQIQTTYRDKKNKEHVDFTLLERTCIKCKEVKLSDNFNKNWG